MNSNDMTYDERYTDIAIMVIGRLHAYQSETYAAPFVNETDYQRLGEAIQRAVLMQHLHEIAVTFGGEIPDAELLFPGKTTPAIEITE